jgi:hypothetical protein
MSSVRHYNGRRPHRALWLRLPRPDRPVFDLTLEQINTTVLGRMTNEYEHAASKHVV